jgi:hypothetical protein
MTRRTPPQTDHDVLLKLGTAIDDVSLSDAEADALLAEAGIDAGSALKHILAMIDTAETEGKRSRYARAEAAREEALGLLARPKRQRSRPELRARIDHIKRIAPPEAQPQAYFKNFESAPDEDLERLVSELEHLLGLYDDGEDLA